MVAGGCGADRVRVSGAASAAILAILLGDVRYRFTLQALNFPFERSGRVTEVGGGTADGTMRRWRRT